MSTAMASMSNLAGTFMFHPRPAVFEHPITYKLPSAYETTSSSHAARTDKNDLSQYYISERTLPRSFLRVVLLAVLER